MRNGKGIWKISALALVVSDLISLVCEATVLNPEQEFMFQISEFSLPVVLPIVKSQMSRGKKGQNMIAAGGGKEEKEEDLLE